MKPILRCVTLAVLASITLTSMRTLGQGPAFSLGTESSLNNAGKLTIILPLRNGGTGTATNVTVSSATLNGAGATTSPLPIERGQMIHNQEVSLTFEFTSPESLVGTKQLLTLRGTYLTNGTTLGFAVNRFIRIPNSLATQDVYSIYGNKTDPGILHAELAEGEVVDFYGTKDSLGHASAVRFARVLSNQGATQYAFDSGSHINHIRFQSGMTWDLDWTSNTATSITATSSDGKTRISTSVNFATGKSVTPALKPQMLATAQSSVLPQAGFNLAAPDVSGNSAVINVMTCGKPEDNATVVSDVGWLLTGRTGIPVPRSGPGQYTLSVPIPDQSAQDDSQGKAGAAAQALEAVCKPLSDAQDTLNQILPGTKIGDVICTSLTALLIEGGPVALEVGAACEVVFAGIEVVCKAGEILKAVNKIIDDVNSIGPVTLHPYATLDGLSATADGAYFSFKSVTGPFSIPTIDLGCRDIKVGVQPTSLSLNIDDQSQITSNVTYTDGRQDTSSTIDLLWSSVDETIATVDQTGIVTGVAGGTVDIFVTEQTTGRKSQPVVVTVSGLPIAGNWAGTATFTNQSGSQDTIQVSASVTQNGKTITATVIFTRSGDIPEIHTETGTFDGVNFSLPVDSQGNAFNVIGRFSGSVMSGSGNTGSGMLTVTQNRLHMSGTATTSAGESMSWSLDKQ